MAEVDARLKELLHRDNGWHRVPFTSVRPTDLPKWTEDGTTHNTVAVYVAGRR
jgi:hypothetical protein